MLGATGKTGRRVVRLLREAGRTVRAASRSGEVTFDWDRPATWGAALDGVATVYLVPPEDPAPVAAFTRQATDAGVSRFVVLSGRGIEHMDAAFGAGMTASERAVRESGVRWTIIRPNNFNQNFDEDLWREPLRSGRLALPTDAVPEPFIDVDDVAEVAAALLTAEGGEHDGQIYELSGPHALTFDEAVAVMARAAGRPIGYERLTPGEYAAELRAAGAPSEVVDALNTMFAVLRAGRAAHPVDGVRRVLGRDARSFDAYADRAAANGAWAREE